MTCLAGAQAIVRINEIKEQRLVEADEGPPGRQVKREIPEFMTQVTSSRSSRGGHPSKRRRQAGAARKCNEGWLGRASSRQLAPTNSGRRAGQMRRAHSINRDQARLWRAVLIERDRQMKPSCSSSPNPR